MTTSSVRVDMNERAEHHAQEAERLLKGRSISSHVKAQVHATLAVYYSARRSNGG
jgi:hypothetical protein